VLVAESVQFVEFTDTVLEQFGSYTGGLTLIKPEQDGAVEIDKLRVRLLITNLLNNAIRHGKDKPIDVDISFSGKSVFLKVIDRGEGIPEEHLSNISEPFYRADSSRQRNTGGFGLGLYLCKLIAQAHGGELIISSKVGKGSEFKVSLPCQMPIIQLEE
jgi:signal transduction histidine kinase